MQKSITENTDTVSSSSSPKNEDSFIGIKKKKNRKTIVTLEEPKSDIEVTFYVYFCIGFSCV